MSRREGPRRSVSREIKEICFSNECRCTSLPLTVKDIGRYVANANLRWSYLFNDYLFYLVFRSLHFIDWRICAKNFTGWLNTILFLTRVARIWFYHHGWINDCIKDIGASILAAITGNLWRRQDRLMYHQEVELIFLSTKGVCISTRDPMDRDSSRTLTLRGLSLLWGTVSPWTRL